MTVRTWLVTGATSGLGYALVEHILAQGDNVIASGRNIADRLAKLECERLSLQELDIASGWDHVRTAIDKAWETSGGIDILVNNAGMSAMKSSEEAEYVTRMQLTTYTHGYINQ